MSPLLRHFRNGKIDEKKLRDLIEFQIKNNTSGIVPCGTTGESATLSFEEHERVIEVTMEQANKRVAVIAGTGSNSTEEAIMLTRDAKSRGNMLLCRSPLIITGRRKPGLYEHFKAVAGSVKFRSCSIILLPVPGSILSRKQLPGWQVTVKIS